MCKSSRARAFVSFFVTIIGSTLLGCSGTDAYITSLFELPDANAVLFATHADDTVWLVQSGKSSKFGRPPFAVAASGNTAVAVGSSASSVVVLKRGSAVARTVDLGKAEPNRQFRVAGLRCDNDSIIARLASTDGKPDVVNSRCIRIQMRDFTTSHATDSEWMSMGEVTPVNAKQERGSGVTLNVYQLSDGASIVNRLAQREESTISYVGVDGKSRELLREDRGRFLSRRMADSGAQYP